MLPSPSSPLSQNKGATKLLLYMARPSRSERMISAFGARGSVGGTERARGGWWVLVACLKPLRPWCDSNVF